MQTSFGEWRGIATGTQPGWEWRARIIAKLIRSTDVVLDIGAGDQKLKRFIPSSCGYLPVDCIDVLPGTFLVDFNTGFRLPEEPFTIAVCAGSLEYINDLSGFFRSFAESASGKQVIFTYLLDEEKLTRREMRVHNHFADIDELLKPIIFAFSHVDVIAYCQRTVFIQATLSAAHATNWISRQPLNDLLADRQHQGKLERFLAKTGRSIRKRFRWEKTVTAG